jgi:CRP-like cAMP-binding protein
MSTDRTDFLARVPLFRGLKDRQLAKLANRFISRNYKAGDTIVTQGKGGEGLFVIVSGTAEAVRERLDGSKAVVNTFSATDFFGEIALLDDGPRTASVEAKQDTTCLVLTRWDLLSVMSDDADMGVIISQELARRFRMALEVL